jgi:hypothetical protein
VSIVNLFSIPKKVCEKANFEHYVECKKLTKHQVSQLENLIIAGLNSSEKYDNKYIVSLQDWMGMSDYDYANRKNRNKFFYLRREFINSGFFKRVALNDEQLALLSERLESNKITKLHLYELTLPIAKKEVSSSTTKIVGGGNLQVSSKSVVEIEGDIDSTGSPTIIAKCLHRFMRTDLKDDRKLIAGEMLIKPSKKHLEAGALPCRLNIVSSSLTSSSIMINDDAVLVCYLYSRIFQRLQEYCNSSIEIDTVFSFQKEEIIKHLGRSSGMGVRAALDKIIDRVTSTEFKITVCKKGDWLMRSFGFVNESGNALSSVRMRLLEPVGEVSDSNGDTQYLSDDTNNKAGTIKSYSQIVVALPKLLERQVCRAIKNTTESESPTNNWPIFKRPTQILTARNHRGLALNLLDKYKVWLGTNGAMNEFCNMKQLFTHLYHLPDNPNYTYLTQSLIKALLNKEFALATRGCVATARAIKFNELYARLDFNIIVRLTCNASNLKDAKLSKLVFNIKAVRLNESQAYKLQNTIPQNGSSGMANLNELENRYEYAETLLRSFMKVGQIPLPLENCA